MINSHKRLFNDVQERKQNLSLFIENVVTRAEKSRKSLPEANLYETSYHLRFH